MERFLASVERRAFRMAEIATGSTEDALDLVQDAMLKLVQRYAGRPEAEWGPLFHRILQSRIRDWQRRSAVRRRWRSWFGRGGDPDGESPDPVQVAPDPRGGDPADHAVRGDLAEALETAVRRLPLRQQQAFLLRVWEGLDVAQTARALGCSEGSVKTHYSRAVHSLRRMLEAYR